MPWTLYRSPRSPYARKVMIAAHELGLAGRLHQKDVMTNPMRPAPDVLPLNPLGMIPVLEADGVMLFDSLTIVEFLNETAGGQLFPAGPARFDCLTRRAVAGGVMDKATRMLDETFRAQQNADTAEHVAGFSAALLRAAEWFGPQLRPERFDAGDIALAAVLGYLDFRFPALDWRGGAGVTARWFAAVSDRPAMQATAYGVAAA